MWPGSYRDGECMPEMYGEPASPVRTRLDFSCWDVLLYGMQATDIYSPMRD